MHIHWHWVVGIKGDNELDVVSERRESPREATERRTHPRVHDWTDKVRDDRRIT